MKAVFGGIGAFILILVVIAALYFGGVFGGGAAQRATANFRGQTSEINKVHADGDYRIAQYNHFYDLCGAIQADELKIANTKASLAGQALSKSQKAAIVLALENQRADDITSYNADAGKADTAANFLASNLPYQINPNKEHTTCVS